VSATPLPPADVVTANLTGAVLARWAGRLLDLVHPDGMLIVSGLLEEERNEVIHAFNGAESRRTRPASPAGWVNSDPPIAWEGHEEGWVALMMKR
jgi:ribosomal protein L11 methylase PrmA